MKKILLLSALFILSLTAVNFADDNEQVITLKDGSQIKGVLSGINNGVYTVKTPIIGDVHVAVGDVSSITNGNAPAAVPTNDTNVPVMPATTPAPGTPASMDQQIPILQQRLMSNPQSMAMLQQMMQNPKIMQALQDPALVQAVQNHDYAAVQSNPVIQELMQDPQMQALAKQAAAQQQQQNTPSQ